MGLTGGYDQSSDSSSRFDRTMESDLSKEQLSILQNREAQYNDFFFPELQSALAQTDINSEESKAALNQQSQQINTTFADSSRQINQNLAKQNLLGMGSGVQASLNAQNSRAKASSLASAYQNTLANNSQEKAALLGIGASLMTTPTTSAQYHQESTTESSGSGFGINGKAALW